MIEPFYQDDAVTIYNADCRDILPELEKFDLLLTDPPYGVGWAKRSTWGSSNLAQVKDYGKQEWDSAPPGKDLIDLCLAISDEQIIWGGNYFHLPPKRCWLVWDKLNGENDFSDAELAWTNLDRAVRCFRFRWMGMIRAGEARNESRVHPTQKPVELMRWCIQLAGRSASPPLRILDPFGGSGTTARAAKDLGHKCVMIERERQYCEAAKARLKQEVLNLNC